MQSVSRRNEGGIAINLPEPIQPAAHRLPDRALIGERGSADRRYCATSKLFFIQKGSLPVRSLVVASS